MKGFLDKESLLFLKFLTKKIIIITGICAMMLIIVCSPFKNDVKKSDHSSSLFAGSQSCIKCHSNIFNSYLHTAHYIASSPATTSIIHGSFINGFNVFTLNDSQKIVMEKSDSGLFQTYYLNKKIKERYRFDIVFGGVKGESYLYWQGNELYQLPISYFNSQHQWSTSPGYKFNFLDYAYSRSIKKQCMECHTSYISDLSEKQQGFNRHEQFDKSSLVFTINCERCHGPAAQHVTFQTENPGIKTAHFITTYSSLNRSQRIDICAVCHSGRTTQLLRSTYEFVPGDSFVNFKIQEFYRAVDTANLDVHGNQVQLLQSSKCYKFSKMDCATCHDPHQNARGNDMIFAQKCLTCHNNSNHIDCKISNKLSTEALKANCINCHMPALPTKVISVQVSDTLPQIKFFVHTHLIATYPQEVKKVLAYINK